MANLPRVC
ncbi:hypothetical protein D018_4441A, partial [Vibrio parahaemolyticus VP2007-007]